jgi:hypothetical protein
MDDLCQMFKNLTIEQKILICDVINKLLSKSKCNDVEPSIIPKWLF